MPERKAYCGWCQALISTTPEGKSLSLRAWSDKLEAATLDFTVEEVPAPLCPKNVTNYLLDGFTMSDVTDEKPDPLVKINDDDMNSFIPVQFVEACHQRDFRNGWRIYRVCPKVQGGGVYTLNFSYGRSLYTEIYVNGKHVETIDKYINGQYTTKQFTVEAGDTPDIRILMHCQNESEYGAGFAGRVEMMEVI